MKRFAKTVAALLIALLVLIGQSGAVLAMDFASGSGKCTKCPCESEKRSCCVEQSNSATPPEAPALPPVESRVLQPITLEPVQVGAFDFSRAATHVSAVCRDTLPPSRNSVPLFLRHRAILI
jgi:hypothetical protein